ncbi:MAG: DedA family protein [Candidatus Thermoplasmatota archaeon]|jgi:membrane protein DedA with SNARE-associated domain|nr:DedA family protein [Candidatus Thermoplasmatota archaeon]MCL5786408.1 DedA family protein [Candidatus Thermoplasmatota archaeon]
MGIISTIFLWTTHAIQAMGYLGVFFLMLLEGALLPIPSEIVMLFGGYEVFQGNLGPLLGIPAFVLLLLAGTVGNLVGALIAYHIGYFGGKPFVKKVGRYLLLDESAIDKTTAWFTKYGKISVFLTRLVPVFRTFISIPAGIAKMNRIQFSLYTFIGSLIWDSVLIYMGYSLGSGWQTVVGIFDQFQYVSLAAFLIIAVWLYWTKLASRNTKEKISSALRKSKSFVTGTKRSSDEKDKPLE